MNAYLPEERLLYALGALDDAILADARITRPAPRRHRLPAVALSALLCLLMMGAGFISYFYADSIQSWFGTYWQQLTGQPMNDGQTALISHLSQELNLSDSVGDVTITVDSATVGEDCFYLLLRAEGIPFDARHSYGFRGMQLDVSPDPLENSGGSAGYGFRYLGTDSSGAAIMLIDYSYINKSGHIADTRPLQLQLTLTDLCRQSNGNSETLLQAGSWQYSFSLERNMLQPLPLPATTVLMADTTTPNGQPQAEILLFDIELTGTGLRYKYTDPQGRYFLLSDICAVLADGTEIGSGDGSSTRMPDGQTYFCTDLWRIPLDTAQITAIRIGDTLIPVN